MIPIGPAVCSSILSVDADIPARQLGADFFLQKSLMVSPNSDCVTAAHKRLLMSEAGIVNPPEIGPAFKVSIALENSQIVFDPAAFDRSYAIKGG